MKFPILSRISKWFRVRKREQTYAEAACAMVGIDPTRLPEFLDARIVYMYGHWVTELIVTTWPVGYIEWSNYIHGRFNLDGTWSIFFSIHPSDQAEAHEILTRFHIEEAGDIGS